ncbi:MAG TPA: MFS transporter [Candidatus Desulfovibrio intestinipullorum]|uniref:MFS transporter n=1 Tax=Candidatus Desulfovibrio intestinipullorum TaxID=2838536 RepID=A0A9D1PXU3_9BACT|nr:MFS transporter [Candidatus Desulfovibrio intestinipullorum]
MTTLALSLPRELARRLVPQTARGNYRMALMFFFFFMGTIFASWATRIPDIKASLQLTDAALGSILFGAPLGELVAIAPSAWLIGKVHTRKAIILSMILLPLALVGLSLAPGRLALFAALFFFGFVYNMANIALNSQAVGVEILYRRSIIATFHGMWSLGGVIGGLIGAVVAPLGVPPLLHFVAITVITLCGLALLQPLIMPREVHIGSSKGEPQKKTRIRPSAFLIILGFIAFGSMATEGAMYDWSAVFFAQVIQPEEHFVRLGYLACMTFMVMGRLLADGLVNRYGVTPVLQASGLCIAAGLTLALTTGELVPATVGLALVGFGMASIVPLCYSLAGRSRTIPAQVGISFVSSISFFGFLACPPTIGFLSHLFGLSWALSPIIVVGLAIFVLATLAHRMRP